MAIPQRIESETRKKGVKYYSMEVLNKVNKGNDESEKGSQK